MIKRLAAAAVIAVSCPAALAAAEFQYYVMPIGGITGISQSANQNASQSGPKYGGMINADYADLLFDSAAQKALIDGFNAEVRQQFPTAVIAPNQVRTSRFGKYAYQPFAQVQCSPTFSANYRDVFAIAVGISRLSAYVNTYADFTQVLVPVTYTVRFVKLDGATVIFSKSETVYTQLTTTTADFFAPGTQQISPSNLVQLKQAVLADGAARVKSLVVTAAKNFSPKQSEVTVIGRDGDYIVFDKGSEVGFSSGEEFDGVDANGHDYAVVIRYATNGLAVGVASDFTPAVKRATNSLSNGDKVTFAFSKQGRDDAKPSVLAIQYANPNGAPLDDREVRDNALMSIVADDIGFQAPFNLIKQDADFARLKNQIRGEANCEATMFRDINGFADNSTRLRPNPDFVLKLDTNDSPALTIAGVGGVTTNTIFNDTVTLSLIDGSNIVGQAFYSSAQYELKRTSGKGLALEQAREVNLKNAALAAKDAMLAGFSARRKTLAITSASGGTLQLGEPLPAVLFDQAQLVRPLEAAGRRILLPLARDEAQLQRPSSDTTKLAYKGQLKSSDLVMLGSANPANRPLVSCAAKQNLYLSDGLHDPSTATTVVERIVGSQLPGFNLIETSPVYLTSVENALRDGFFSNPVVAKNADAPICVLAMEMQKLPKQECAGGQCAGAATMASGVRLFDGANKLRESVLGAQVEFSERTPDSVSPFVGLKTYEYQLNSISQHIPKLQ